MTSLKLSLHQTYVERNYTRRYLVLRSIDRSTGRVLHYYFISYDLQVDIIHRDFDILKQLIFIHQHQHLNYSNYMQA